MNIFVCMKQVPGTDQPIKILPEGIDTDGVDFVISPYDEYAIEESLKIRDTAKNSGKEASVTVVTMGPERCTKALRQALAMGADHGIHLCDPQFDDLDSLQTAKVLAAALKDKGASLIWTGKQAADDDMSTVGPALAEFLSLPHVTDLKAFALSEDGSRATVTREVEGGCDVLVCPLPAVFTANKGLNEPRYASLKGIMMAKKKPVDLIDAAGLGLDASVLGADKRMIQTRTFAAPETREAAHRKIEGDLGQIVGETVRVLKEELKII